MDLEDDSDKMNDVDESQSESFSKQKKSFIPTNFDPSDLKEGESRLISIAFDLAEAAVSRINKFWGMTDYSGEKLQPSDVNSSIINSQRIEMSAKCLVCDKFIRLNMVESRNFSITNYKNHAGKHVIF